MTRPARALFLFHFLLAADVAAAPLPEKGAAWRPVEVWRQPQGLPQNSVLALRQTRDGYLWIGTKGGLARFDGIQFATWDDRDKRQLRENEVWALAEGADGSLWIGTYGGGVSRLKDGRFAVYTKAEGLVNDYVTDLCTAPDGTVWIATDGGMSRFADGHFVSYTAADGLSHTALRSLLCERDGTVWIGSSDGRVNRHAGGRILTADVPGITPGSEVKAFLRASDGALWIATTDGALRVQDGRATRFTTAHGLPSRWVLAVHEDPAGQIWIGAEGGLSRYLPESGTFHTLGMEVTWGPDR